MKRVWLLGFLVNFFLLAAVFDIHFKSPIVQVKNTHRSPHLPPTPRIFFFVADGLRRDTFFDNPHLRPYLTKVMNKEDGVTWGISDTRVPTESRPGHIALFAGFYEDPSAVFTGWKNNLVEFDSIFNRTKGAVALGSPDVVKMFAQGAAKSKIYSETYPSDWQDFLEANSSFLDTWVFDKLNNLMDKQQLPRHDNLLVFLHLLGIDNTGHATKPHSEEYKTGLLVVDDIVLKVEGMVANYYGDNDTLFVFTSDHGMTDWGSHGSGSLDETETPLVVWGPGIRKTENIRIKQADVTALMAGALSCEFPTNSVGKFPTQIWKDDSFVFASLKTNLLQVRELAETKKNKVELERNFPLAEYYEEEKFSDTLARAEKLAEANNFKEAIIVLESAFDEALEANIYYERYNQQLMMFFSVTIFGLFMILVASTILGLGSHLNKTLDVLDLRLFTAAFIIASLISKGVIGWSMWRIGYSLVPSYLTLLLCFKFRQMSGMKEKKKSLFLSLCLSILGVQMLVLSFWERSVLSVTLVLNLVWVLWSHCALTRRRMDLLMHFVAVVALALFPLVPIIGNSRSPFFTTLGPLISCAVVGLVLNLGRIQDLLSNREKWILTFQLLSQLSVSFLTHFPTSSITRIISWTTLLLSMLMPTLITSKMLIIRLLSIFLALSTPFSFLCISYEALFFPSLFVTLLLFLKLETESEKPQEERNSISNWKEFLTLSHDQDCDSGKRSNQVINIHRAFRRAWLHLFFVLLSFFGTGNIGSLSSFDPSSTRCFLNVFNPWLMMLLMLSKILAPFLLVSSFWRALLPNTIQVERNFGILLLLCQGMSLTMFFKVRNQGSWLEIGMSISHFVIVQATTLFLLLFHFIANYLITFELFSINDKLPTRRRQQKASKHL